jgi:hypothetical protein
MQRYESKFRRNLYDYIHAVCRFKETVIHVQKYLDILKDELEIIKRELPFYKGDTLQLFNERFYTYKIQFVIYDNYPGEGGIYEGKSSSDNIIIYLNEKFYFYTEKENLDVFKYFEKELIIILSHELVHRGQYYVRAGDKINFYNFDGNASNSTNMEYMKNPQEIMAYAYMYIESLRYSGFKNDQILKMLKSGNFAKSQSLHINFYINEMNKFNRDAFLKFRKYIYQYIIDPIRYDLKVI